MLRLRGGSGPEKRLARRTPSPSAATTGSPEREHPHQGAPFSERFAHAPATARRRSGRSRAPLPEREEQPDGVAAVHLRQALDERHEQRSEIGVVAIDRPQQ